MKSSVVASFSWLASHLPLHHCHAPWHPHLQLHDQAHFHPLHYASFSHPAHHISLAFIHSWTLYSFPPGCGTLRPIIRSSGAIHTPNGVLDSATVINHDRQHGLIRVGKSLWKCF